MAGIHFEANRNAARFHAEKRLKDTLMELFLVICLICALGYIIWLEQQPKTDEERRKENERRERLEIAMENERAKRERIKQRKADGGQG